MSPFQSIAYAAYCKLVRGVSWDHRPEYKARLLARCRRSLRGVLDAPA